MMNAEGLKQGMEKYGPRTNVTEARCKCGHGAKDHNASGSGEACDCCGCGVFHGVGAKATGRPEPMKT